MFPNKVVQDGDREEYVRQLFDLQPSDGCRHGVDAYLGRVPFELKSTSKSHGGVSTARDLSYGHINKWSNRYWLVGNFTNRHDGFVFDRFYLLNPAAMAGWYRLIEARLERSVVVRNRVLDACRRAGLAQEDIDLTERAFIPKLNDPNISGRYIRENGAAIDMERDHRQQLRILVEQSEAVIRSGGGL